MKITDKQANVLRAYKDGTLHNEGVRTFSSCVKRGFLVFGGYGPYGMLTLSIKGNEALSQHSQKG